MSVRVALGASRWRLARQMLIEGVMLSSCASALGVLFAAWTSRAISALITGDFLVPTILDVAPDGRVLAFAATAGITAGVLFSVAPAWRAAREDPAGSLRLNTRSLTAAGRTGKALIVSQVALSLVLRWTLGCSFAACSEYVTSTSDSGVMGLSRRSYFHGPMVTATSMATGISPSWRKGSPRCQACAPRRS